MEPCCQMCGMPQSDAIAQRDGWCTIDVEQPGARHQLPGYCLRCMEALLHGEVPDVPDPDLYVKAMALATLAGTGKLTPELAKAAADKAAELLELVQ
jgi:hypothetical protein